MNARDWGEAPATIGFVGRADELAVLERWVMEEHSRVVAVLGMGGIGKTSLAARLAENVARRSLTFTGAACAMRHP